MLQVEGIDVFYGRLQILHEVSLTVDKGETVVIIGPNGAGKTTLIRSISGLLKPMRGRILFESEDITKVPPYRIVERGIAVVPEGGSLFPYLSVKQNLILGSNPKRARRSYRENLEKVFDLFPRLKEREDQLASTLSGGERQMLAIGRALMSNPKFIILDEPSAGLAPLMVNLIMDIVKSLNDSGYSILMVEQNAKKSLKVATRAYLLENGRIVFHDYAEDFMKRDIVQKSYLGI